MSIEIEHGGEVCILRISGHLRSGDDPAYVQDKADEIRGHECKHLLVDLRELQSLGSMGMGFLAGVYVYITKRSGGGRFILVGAGQRVRAVLDLTHLSSIIPMATDLASGLATLKGEGPAARSAGE
jgi:anti-anti-sigma factor